MDSVIYQTKVPSELSDFCEFIAILWGDVERNLYKDILRHESINDCKRNYQVLYGINARQLNSIHASLQGKRI